MTSSSRSPAAPGHQHDAPTGDTPAQRRVDEEAPATTRLSLTQVVASGLAAVSATVLMSFFGVAGTIIGAGLASVVTVVGNFLYTRSIERTQAQLKPVVANIRPGLRPRTTLATPRSDWSADARRTTTSLAVGHAGGVTTVEAPTDTESESAGSDGGQPASAAFETVRLGQVSADGEPTDLSERADAAPEPRNRWLRLIDRHGKVKVLTVSALALFAVVMGVVLAIELAIGKPISDAVRGQEGSGTSISSIRGGAGTDAPAGTDTEERDGTDDGSGDDGRVQQEQNQDAPADDPATVPGTDPTSPTDGTDPTDVPTDGTTDDSGDTGTDDSGDTWTDDSTGTGTGDGSGDTGTGTDTGTDTGSEDVAPDTGSIGPADDGATSSSGSGSGALDTVEKAPAS